MIGKILAGVLLLSSLCAQDFLKFGTIYGAYNFGIKSIFISSGKQSNIFQSNHNKNLQNIIKEHSEYKVLPDFVCEKLSF